MPRHQLPIRAGSESSLSRRPLRRPFRTGAAPISCYSTHRPATSSPVLLPYFIGGVGGVVAVGAGAYAYYHFSGAKKVAEKITAAKQRYDDAKATVVEQGGVAREKLEAAKDAVKVKAAGWRDLWATRGSRSKGDGKQ